MLIYLYAKSDKVQLPHKGIVCSNRIVRTDVLLNARRKQLVLLARACDVRHPNLESVPDPGAIMRNHKRVMTQPEFAILNVRLVAAELEHEISGKAVHVALDGLVESAGLHAVDRCKVAIQAAAPPYATCPNSIGRIFGRFLFCACQRS